MGYYLTITPRTPEPVPLARLSSGTNAQDLNSLFASEQQLFPSNFPNLGEERSEAYVGQPASPLVLETPSLLTDENTLIDSSE